MGKNNISLLRQNIAIAALLHDIGKFYQRAESYAATDKSEYLTADIKKQMNSICGSHWSHKHALWTAQFLSEYENHIFSNRLDPSVYMLASYHHNADKLLEKIIKYADWISSGTDRRLDENLEELQRSYNFRKQKLMPVFESLFVEDHRSEKRYRYPLQELTCENGFPEETNDDTELFNDYKNLWSKFTTELKYISTGSFDAWFESFSALLKKYTWCIPSSTIDRPDISLYDHMKSTAAIALVMFDYLHDRYPGEIDKPSSRIADHLFNNDDEKFIKLICGDLSGIQNFIYQITSAKANVSLKGRSFAVQLICDICARTLLSELGLNSSNLIYSSGGNFYILAANTENTDKKLKDFQLKINKGLYRRYKGELYLSLGSTVLSAKDLIITSSGGKDLLGEKWQEAISNAAEAKLYKFRDLMLEEKDFFEPFGTGGKSSLCSVCGSDEDPSDLRQEGNNTYCFSCSAFIKLGQQLRNADYLCGYSEEDDKKQLIPGISLNYRPIRTADISAFNFDSLSSINNTDFLKDNPVGAAYSKNFIFYGGNMVPMRGARIADFSDLATADDPNDSDFKRLAVLRLDVDYLGYLFKKGFTSSHFAPGSKDNEQHYYSLSRLSTLSSMLDYFFSAHINFIHLSSPQFSEHIQVVYSGGDDLFLVGRWNAVLDMAMMIYDAFKRFTAHHPWLSLSGGMLIITESFPISRAADLAGAREQDAKNFVSKSAMGIKEKDAFSLLGKVMHWHDLKIIKMMKDDIVYLTEKTESRGLLSRLRTLYLSYENEKQNLDRKASFTEEKLREMLEYGKWRWRLIYNLARFVKSTSLEEDKKDIIKEIQLSALEGRAYRGNKSYCNLRDYLDIPLRWAELELRQKSKNK